MFLFQYLCSVHWVNNDVTRPRFPLEELVTVKHLYTVQYSVHCANNNLNLHVKTEPVTAGADTTENVRLLLFIFIYIWLRNQTQTIEADPTVTGSVFVNGN